MSHRHGVDCNGYECMEREDLTFDQHMCEHVRDCTLPGWECRILSSPNAFERAESNTVLLVVYFKDGSHHDFYNVAIDSARYERDILVFEVGDDIYNVPGVLYWISK